MSLLNFFRSSKKQSKTEAKKRLQLVLIQDRMHLESRTVNQLKDELLEVVGRHLDIVKDGVEVNIEKDGTSIAIVANIPVQQSKAM